MRNAFLKTLNPSAGATPSYTSDWPVQVPYPFMSAPVTLTDGATITPVMNVATSATASGGAGYFVLTAASNAARAFAAPTGAAGAGAYCYLQVKNTSGAALTNTTFGASIKSGSVTWPATGFNRFFVLFYDGTNWYVQQLGPDVSN